PRGASTWPRHAVVGRRAAETSGDAQLRVAGRGRPGESGTLGAGGARLERVAGAARSGTADGATASGRQQTSGKSHRHSAGTPPKVVRHGDERHFASCG